MVTMTLIVILLKTLSVFSTLQTDTITLTLASNKEKDAITDIVNLINGGPHTVGVITIADNVNQVYASTHITDVAGSLDS